MKGLAELTAENDALVRRAEERENAKYRRLKQRIARLTRSPHLAVSRRVMREQLNAAIDAWRKAEAMRGGK